MASISQMKSARWREESRPPSGADELDGQGYAEGMRAMAR